MFHCLALLMLIDTSLACWSKGEEPGKPGKNNTEILLKYLNKMQGGSNPGFNGFEVPDSVKKEWADWLAEYKAKQLQDMEDTKDFYADGGPGAGIPGWPENWKGFHKGDEGFPPQEVPPWGYKAKNLGLPSLCYLNADAGNCGNSTVRKRWGFNAHMQECMEFDYSGCGGNINNFDTEIACYEKCSNPVSGGCDMETDIKVRDISIAGGPGARRCGRTVQEKDSHGKTIH